MESMPVYVPYLIFLARILDVSIGTVRLVMIIDGRRFVAAILGFVEVLVWVLAVGSAIKHLDHAGAVFGYAGGFAAGVYVGMLLEDRIKLGFRVVRAINHDRSVNLASALRERGFRATRVEGEGRDGPVELVFSAVKRRRLQALTDAIRSVAPSAMVTVERVEVTGGDEFGAAPRTAFSRLGGLRK